MSTIAQAHQFATIEQYAARDVGRWNAFVRSSRNGTFLFLRDYMDYHADRFPDHSLLVSDRHGDLIALLPAHKSGTHLISHGGLTYGGFLFDRRMTATLMLQVFEASIAEMLRQGVTKLTYKSIPHIYHDVPAGEDQYALFRAGARLTRRDHLAVIDYRGGNERQERRQRAIRKAVRQGVTVRETADFRDFWEILTETLVSRYGVKPVHTIEEIELLHARFPDRIRLFAAYQDGKMLGGVVLYVSEHVCHSQYIAASEHGKERGALDLLFDHMIEEFAKKVRYFDFGTSTERSGFYLNEGLAEFKEGFGARTVLHDHYELDLTAMDPSCFRNSRP